jgi:hypothetical protein
VLLVASREEFLENMELLKKAVAEVEDEWKNLDSGHANALEPLENAGRAVMVSAQACQEWTG